MPHTPLRTEQPLALALEAVLLLAVQAKGKLLPQ